jgi:hypothetical protein
MSLKGIILNWIKFTKIDQVINDIKTVVLKILGEVIHMYTQKLEVGIEQYIEFDFIRKNVKNINLTVRPDFSITVSENQNISLEKIHEFVNTKSSCIQKRKGRFR